ncbi:GLIPR1-like protein 1 [Denticeps clupeoides]|uniref:SCP domain-containing protein n=1 Tax=Denticeps clupeoides TaxID=299321 RepID=A0AAY4ERG6_9TELE|nr:peptidase inhibitor 16 [Denticeps clupeoides]
MRSNQVTFATLLVIIAAADAQLSEEDKATIVDQHNVFRSQVDPTATYMRKMKWDENLKVVAEQYAAKCVWDHNPDLEDTGENLYATNGAFDPTKAITEWYNEHKFYDYDYNNCTDGEMCGHYTQVVWADTYRVGCATYLCEKLQGLAVEKSTLFVCNYYPAGNFIGEKPYENGDSCSKCPDDFSVCDHNICAPDIILSTTGPEWVTTTVPEWMTTSDFSEAHQMPHTPAGTDGPDGSTAGATDKEEIGTIRETAADMIPYIIQPAQACAVMAKPWLLTLLMTVLFTYVIH